MCKFPKCFQIHKIAQYIFFLNFLSLFCILIYNYMQVFLCFCLLLSETWGNSFFKHFSAHHKAKLIELQILNLTAEHTFHHITLFGLHLAVTKPFPFVYRLITAWWGFSTNTFAHWSLCKDTSDSCSIYVSGREKKLWQDMQAVSGSDIKRAGASSEHPAIPTQISFCTTCARATAMNRHFSSALSWFSYTIHSSRTKDDKAGSVTQSWIICDTKKPQVWFERLCVQPLQPWIPVNCSK